MGWKRGPARIGGPPPLVCCVAIALALAGRVRSRVPLPAGTIMGAVAAGCDHDRRCRTVAVAVAGQLRSRSPLQVGCGRGRRCRRVRSQAPSPASAIAGTGAGRVRRARPLGPHAPGFHPRPAKRTNSLPPSADEPVPCPADESGPALADELVRDDATEVVGRA